MAEKKGIKDIPYELVKKHKNWHKQHGHSGVGAGEKFLKWHSAYIQEFSKWWESANKATRPKKREIKAWKEIPAELKKKKWGWDKRHADDEKKLQDMANFSTHDQLGRHILKRLHDFLHGAAAKKYKDPFVGSSKTAPRSTYFWQIHGLIENWSKEWLRAHRGDAVSD